MICRLCGEVFLPELTFSTLFRPPWCCPSCRDAFRPGWFEECIPYAGGIIDFRYVYAQENADPYLETWLFRNMEKCFNLAIARQSEYGFVLLVGEREYADAAAWLPYLRGFGRVLFLSLFWKDFSRYEDSM